MVCIDTKKVMIFTTANALSIDCFFDIRSYTRNNTTEN